MASTLGAVSGTDSPYKTGSYTVEQNDKNTLTMTGYFQLLATQLQNQDMSNPMDNSELMAQMTQMAMVQSVHDRGYEEFHSGEYSDLRGQSGRAGSDYGSHKGKFLWTRDASRCKIC